VCMSISVCVRHRHPPTRTAGGPQQQPVDLWPHMVVWKANLRSAWDLGERPKKTAQYLAHTHTRTHARAVSSSNVLSSHAHRDPPTNSRRRQFPVHPSFAMTINKAQRQTLKMVGIFLPEPIFTHGQLYVAMSRIGCPEGVKLLVIDKWEDAHEDAPAGVYTRNVVYTEVL